MVTSITGDVLISLLSGGVGGALSGAAVVLFERRLRRRGDITPNFRGFTYWYRSGRKPDGEGGFVDTQIVPTNREIDHAAYFEYSFNAELFSDKDIASLCATSRSCSG